MNRQIKKSTEAERARIVQLRNDGWGMAAIAEEVSLSERTVRRVLKERPDQPDGAKGVEKCTSCKKPTCRRALWRGVCLACRLRSGDAADTLTRERTLEGKIFDAMVRRGGAATVAQLAGELAMGNSQIVGLLTQCEWFSREGAGRWRIAKT